MGQKPIAVNLPWTEMFKQMGHHHQNLEEECCVVECGVECGVKVGKAVNAEVDY